MRRLFTLGYVIELIVFIKKPAGNFYSLFKKIRASAETTLNTHTSIKVLIELKI